LSATLTFTITLTDGTVIGTIRDAMIHIASLTPEQRAKNQWLIANKLLNTASHEPSYLSAATLSFETACLLEGTLERPSPLDNNL
jgi:hypothetical protein